jgi:uncharacterized membrane protein YkoI
MRRGLIVAATLAAAAFGGVSIARATGGGGDDGGEHAITGSALERASTVALRHTGGGRVTATEVGDEEGYYEVEVTRDDGSQVDVHLDRSFQVLGEHADSEVEESP